ncbi:MAG: hypothetical protein KatS3mg105_1126 [Gemmatales bacterium]|nr:MAG: hypothetical protein KatS3mg105_1126 [Gemmatales bacterium]
MPTITVFTIGHSNHSIDRFIALLKQHRIEALVDVRRYPASRRLPHFNRPHLAKVLAEHGIEYHWLQSLGGQRQKGLPDSPNLGIKEGAFRNYADHMLSDEFRNGVDRLLQIGDTTRTAMMCAESSFRQCHRKLLSDFLLANGVTVQHILASGDLEPHQLSEGAKAASGNVTYPASLPLFE